MILQMIDSPALIVDLIVQLPQMPLLLLVRPLQFFQLGLLMRGQMLQIADVFVLLFVVLLHGPHLRPLLQLLFVQFQVLVDDRLVDCRLRGRVALGLLCLALRAIFGRALGTV